jgi:hypothetical protein
MNGVVEPEEEKEEESMLFICLLSVCLQAGSGC